MTNFIDTTKIAFSSLAATLQDRTPGTGTLTVAGGTSIPASSTITRTISVPLVTARVDSIDRVRVNGTGDASVEGYWFITSGYIRPKSSGSFLVEVLTSNSNTDRNFLFRLINNTGAPLALPALTLDVYCRFYNYPWTG